MPVVGMVILRNYPLSELLSTSPHSSLQEAMSGNDSRQILK